MNILQIAFHTSPFNEIGKNDGGGMSIYVQQISRHLSDNHNVTVAVSYTHLTLPTNKAV